MESGFESLPPSQDPGRSVDFLLTANYGWGAWALALADWKIVMKAPVN